MNWKDIIPLDKAAESVKAIVTYAKDQNFAINLYFINKLDDLA